MPEIPDGLYHPLSSIWQGTDANLLELMIGFYQRIMPEPILDATYNVGRFWKGTTRKVVSMDHDPAYRADHVCDNRQMPGVPSGHFGCVVYDPPHCGNNGRDKSVKRFDVLYGCNVDSLKAEGYTLSHLYPPFLSQAKRVLKPEGLLLAKITDMVNNHRSRWAHCDFMRMAEGAGLTVCDLVVKVRKGPMVSSKWKTAHHARKRHCFWVVCRNSTRCE